MRSARVSSWTASAKHDFTYDDMDKQTLADSTHNNDQNQGYSNRHSHFGFITTIVLLSLLCIAFFIMFAGDHFIPIIAEKKVQAFLDTLALRGRAEFTIKTINMNTAEVACIFKENDSQFGVGKIGSLTIKYKLSELLNGKFDSITADNCDVLVVWDDNGVSIPALNIFNIFTGDTPKTQEKKTTAPVTDLNALIPVSVGNISISGNVVAVTKTADGTDLSFIPYQIALTPDSVANWNKLEYKFSARNAINTIKINGSYMHPEKQLHLNLNKFTFSTLRLPGIVKEKIPRGLRASLDMSSDLYFNLDTFSFRKDSGLSGTVQITYRDREKKIKVDTTTSFRIAMPEDDHVSCEIKDLSGEYDGRTISIPSILATANLKDQTADGSFSLITPDSETADFAFHCEKDNDALRAKLSMTNSPVLNVALGDNKLTYQPELFRAEYAMGKDTTQISALLDGKALGFSNAAVSCSATGLYASVSSNDGQNFDIKANLSNIAVTDKDRKFVCSTPEVSLTAAYRDGILRGESVCGNAQVRAPEFDAEVKDVSWHIPFALTDDADTLKQLRGSVKCGQVIYKDHEAASFDGVLTWPAQKSVKLVLDTQLFTFLGNVTADVSFEEGLKLQSVFDIPEQSTDLSKHIVEFMPKFEEIACEGVVAAHAEYNLVGGKMSGSAEISGKEISLSIPKQKLEMQGGRFKFKIPDLNDMRSAPGQLLSFKSLNYDQIKLGRFMAAYHMETPEIWQLENAVIDWCDGHIRLGGVTYKPEQKRFPVTLYCDRLDLPMFLTQLKLGTIAGSGKISGTIPVMISKENVVFQDAFLYSTPGEEGNIQASFDKASMSDSAEVKLACDALKDFSYQWIRLKIETGGEKRDELKLSIELDGKPNQPLYYSFDGNSGGFIPSESPCIFQGIDLDFNLNISSSKTLELINYFNQFKIQ